MIINGSWFGNISGDWWLLMVMNDGYSGCFVLELLEDFYGLLWEMLMEILEESDVIFQYSSVISLDETWSAGESL